MFPDPSWCLSMWLSGSFFLIVVFERDGGSSGGVLTHHSDECVWWGQGIKIYTSKAMSAHPGSSLGVGH